MMTSPAPTRVRRVLIADDHEVVRRGIRGLLDAEPDLEVCGEAVDGRDAVRKAAQLAPDAVVIDIGMPELNGLEAIRQIKQAQPGIVVLVVSLHDSEQMVHDVLAAGAVGYVLKSDAGHHLVAAVRTILEGGAFLTPKVESLVLAGYLRNDRRAAEPGPPSALTPREREVVQLLAEGKGNKEVGSALGVSVHTAETHRANVMRKLDLHSLTDIVRYAIRNGMIAA
jgi:DNA-binding NarL/FixJ family response regulator